METNYTYGWGTAHQTTPGLGCAVHCSWRPGRRIESQSVKPVRRPGRLLHRAAHPRANMGLSRIANLSLLHVFSLVLTVSVSIFS
jgi:hypothetical protein